MSEQQDGPAAVMFAADRASLGLGMELAQAGQGTATVRMTVTPAMINGHALAHGGYLFLLADTAFVAPAREGDTLTATATERVRYGRSGVYDVTVRRGDEVIAEFRGRSRTI